MAISWKTYGLAGLSDSVARGVGTTQAGPNNAASLQLDIARRRRAQLLQHAVASGKLNAATLGPNDKNLLGSAEVIKFGKQGGGIGLPGFITKPAELLGNLGYDIGQAGKYLPGGIKTLLSGIGSNIIHPQQLGTNKDPLLKNIVNPSIKSFSQTYGPLARGNLGGFAHNLFEHPLGPILDAASVVSVGTSGAAKLGGLASRTGRFGGAEGRIGQLRNLTNPEGRPSITHPRHEELPALPRDYTPRPISRIGQRILDQATSRSQRLGSHTYTRVERRAQREADLALHEAKYSAVTRSLENLRPMLNLSPQESTALTLAQMGLNTRSKIARFEKLAQDSLDSPETMKELENLGVSPEYLQRNANVGEKVKDIVDHPENHPAVLEAHSVWIDDVRRSAQEQGITYDDFERSVYAPSRELGIEPDLPREDYPIEITHVPEKLAQDIVQQRSVMNRLTRGRAGRGAVAPDPGDQAFERVRRPAKVAREVTFQTIAVPRRESFMTPSSGADFGAMKAGALRTDARNYFESVARRESDIVERGFKQDQLQLHAVKDPATGELSRFKNQDDANRKLGRGYVVIPDEFPIQWFHNETNYMERVTDVLNNYLQDEDHNGHVDVFTDPGLEDILSKITDLDARAFVGNMWGAVKRKGVAVSEDFADYQRQLQRLELPYEHSWARFMQRWMNRWRMAVLPLMPRWWLNTAAGSFLLNTIHGVNFNDYWIANRLNKAGLSPEGAILKKGDEGFARSESFLPPGANIGHQGQLEFFQDAARTYTEQLGVHVPIDELLRMVQGIENFHRRAAFIHALQRRDRLHRDNNGQIVDLGDDGGQAIMDVGRITKEHYDEVLGRFGGNVSEALSNEQVVKKALDDTNKMSYNYAVLGPFERRVVRQFIPFWGWYKFISKLAWRLPIEYPGRSNAIRLLSQISADEEGDLGPLPDWIKGSLILGHTKGKIRYLPTFGINPFSQVFNPLNPGQGMRDIFQLGQLNPIIGAALQASGTDTLTGGQVRISPQEGVGTDFFGALVRENTGEPVNPGQVAPFRRGAMALARSIPEFRLSERYILNRGRSVFPESVPFIAPRYMNAKGPAGGRTGVGAVALGALGGLDRPYDIASYQELLRKRALYVQRRNQRQRDRIAGRIP